MEGQRNHGELEINPPRSRYETVRSFNYALRTNNGGVVVRGHGQHGRQAGTDVLARLAYLGAVKYKESDCRAPRIYIVRTWRKARGFGAAEMTEEARKSLSEKRPLLFAQTSQCELLICGAEFAHSWRCHQSASGGEELWLGRVRQAAFAICICVPVYVNILINRPSSRVGRKGQMFIRFCVLIIVSQLSSFYCV